MNSSTNLVQIIALLTVFSQDFLISFANSNVISRGGDEINCYSVTSEINPIELIDDSSLTNPIEISFFNQKITETKCSNEGAHCFDEIYSNRHGNATCVTLYSPIILYYRVGTSNELKAPFEIKVATGCACKIRRIN